MFTLLVAAVSAPLAGVGSAASSSPSGVHAVVVGSDGQLVAVERGGGTHSIGVDASITGRTIDLDGDGVLETPFVDPGGTLRLAEPDGATTTLAEGAPTSKSAIAVGDLDGDGTPAVFYPNTSDSSAVYKVEVGPTADEPVRVTPTAANGVAGVGDLDGDDRPELGFAGSSSTIKYVDGDAVESTGYSSIGSNSGGFGLGGVADVDGDGVARVTLVDGSGNVGLIAADGSKRTISAVSAAKAPVAAANWTAAEGLEILYLDTNGKLSYTTLDGQHERVLDADGSPIEGARPAGVAASPGLAAPRITDYAVENPAGREIRLSITADKRLDAIRVDVAGADPTTLERPDFEASGDGPYTYAATYRADTDGNYTATLETAVGPDGNDGAHGRQGNVTIRTPHPTVENATIADVTDDDGAVGGNHTVAITAEVPNAIPENVTVAANASAFGASEVVLAHTGGSTYAANRTVNASAVPEDGSQQVTVVATNQYGNEGQATTGSLVVDTTPPSADAGPDVSPTAGTSVTFDGDGSTDATDIEQYRWTLGDGTTATGKSVTHVYDEPGTYTATLTVTDGVGNTATDTVTVTVEETDDRSTSTPTSTPTEDDSTEGDSTEDGSTGGDSTEDGSTGGDSTEDGSTEGDSTEGDSTEGDSTGGDSTEDDSTGDDSTDGEDTEVIVVDEGTTVETWVEAGVVTVDVSGATAGNSVAMSIPAGGVGDDSRVVMERMTVRPTRDGALRVTVDGNASAPAGVVPVNRTRAVEPLAYWTVGHDAGDGHVEGATFEFSVRSALLDGARPDAVTLYRIDQGSWTAYDAQVLDADGDRYRYRAHAPGLSAFTVGVRKPQFSVERATLQEARVTAGETVTATATVENDGSTAVTRTLSFRLGEEQVANRTVTVPADGRRTLTFGAERTEAGEFDAVVAGVSSGTLTVIAPTTATATATTTATTTPTPPTPSGFDPGGPILLALSVGVGVGYYLLTRHVGSPSVVERLPR